MSVSEARKAARIPAVPVYGIADLHLPECIGWGLNGSTPTDPWKVLSQSWKQNVPDNALVLLPGDLCHHKDPEEARKTYSIIDRLPGKHKIIVPGNHDWPTGKTLRDLSDVTQHTETIIPLVGTAVRLELNSRGVVIAGTCGAWPTMNGGGARRPCYKKELRRMQNALSQARSLQESGDGIITMLHYPPRPDGRPTRMSKMIEEARSGLCVYGHVHDPERWRRLDARRHGPTTYRFIAADFLGLHPKRLGEIGRRGLRAD